MNNLYLAKKYLEKLKQYVIAAAATNSVSSELVALGLDVVSDLVSKAGTVDTSPAQVEPKKEYLNRWDKPLVNPAITLSEK